MSNSLDPDQAQQIIGPNSGPNCLPKLSADDKIVNIVILQRYLTKEGHVPKADSVLHLMLYV